MDCNCNRNGAGPGRPQMPQPPCMNTNCSAGCGRPPMCPPVEPCARGSRPMEARPMERVLTPQMDSCSGNRQGSMGSMGSIGSIGNDRCKMPIGMCYVPWQQWNQTYSIEQGFSRGTIFPELDLPFVMGRCR